MSVCVAACPPCGSIHTTHMCFPGQAAEVCIGAVRIVPGIVLTCSVWYLVLFQAMQALAVLTLTLAVCGIKISQREADVLH